MPVAAHQSNDLLENDAPIEVSRKNSSRQDAFMLKVGSQNRAFEYSKARTSRYILGADLEDRIPGFTQRVSTVLMIHLVERNCDVYSYHRGGHTWAPTIPPAIAHNGDVFAAIVLIPREEDFVRNLTPLNLANELGIRWMADTVYLSTSVKNGKTIQLQLEQNPSVSGISNFVVEGHWMRGLRFDKGIAYLDFQIKDSFGGSRTIRIYHDGHNPPKLGIRTGREFCPVFFISSDGIRLRVAYRDCRFNPHVATIYTADPSSLYESGEMTNCGFRGMMRDVSAEFRIAEVKLVRPIENVILKVGATYDVGRLGAEIALAVARQKIGLDDVVMVEPSQPGIDLSAAKGKIAIQARLLVHTRNVPPVQIDGLVQAQLRDMLRLLRRDSKRIHSAQVGYAILSYTNIDWTMNTIVLAVPFRQGKFTQESSRLGMP